MATANKGEWSEIYAFFKILSERTLASADENLQPIKGKDFNVLRVIRTEAGLTKIYDLVAGKDEVRILDAKGNVLQIVNSAHLRTGVKQIFKTIKAGKSSFRNPTAEKAMRAFLCRNIKASNADKSDIILVLHDRYSSEESESGFSIKTAYAATPTLLNASRSNTNFRFRLETGSNSQKKNQPEEDIRDRVKALGGLRFEAVEGSTFAYNLGLIDTQFARILAVMLENYYRGAASRVSDLTQMLTSAEQLSDLGADQESYKYKVKQFLEAVALGMTPARKWDGINTAKGGYIVVKDDGELACYHVYERERFLEYLFNHTRLDTPSTTRHGFGVINTDGKGDKTISLNLQIRFT